MKYTGYVSSEIMQFFRDYPLFLNFKITQGKSPVTLENCTFDDAYGKTRSADEMQRIYSLIKNHPFANPETNRRVALICEQSLEHFTKYSVENEPKFRKLMIEACQNIKLLIQISPYLIEAKCLIQGGVNKDILFNHLQELKNRLLTSDAYLLKVSPPSLIRKIADMYPPDRACELYFSREREITTFKSDSKGTSYRSNQHQEAEDLFIALEEIESDWDVDPRDIFPQVKSLRELHEEAFDYLSEQRRFSGLTDYDLNPHPKFLKLNERKVVIQGEELHVVIPTTLFELIPFSRRQMFDNCVGKSDSYAKGVKEGKWTIIGFFNKEGKPKYCIQASDSQILQAKGVSNSLVAKNIENELHKVLFVPRKKKKLKLLAGESEKPEGLLKNV